MSVIAPMFSLINNARKAEYLGLASDQSKGGPKLTEYMFTYFNSIKKIEAIK